MNRTNLQDQVKRVRSGFELSIHSFFSELAQAIRDKLDKDADIQLIWAGKKSTRKKVSGALTGEIRTDPDKVERTAAKVSEVMGELKNPTNLIELLK